MELHNYKTMKKNEWQELAKSFGISYEEKSGIRYLAEKIAEKIGVDDKIVNDNELKRQVVEKLNSDIKEIDSRYITTKETPIEVSTVAEKSNTKDVKAKTPVKKVSTKKSAKKNLVPKEPVIKKVDSKDDNESNDDNNSEKEITKVTTPAVVLSRLEQLRQECESYGIAWAEGHTETNLEQVLQGVKNAGVQPIAKQPSINTNESFEINSSNVDEIANSIDNLPQQTFAPATTMIPLNPFPVKAETPTNGGYTSSNTYLDTYKNIYLNAIRGHWRLLSLNDIHDMIKRDTQSFTYEINLNPQQPNKAEIILKQDSFSVRIPSENNDEWIDING